MNNARKGELPVTVIEERKHNRKDINKPRVFFINEFIVIGIFSLY